MKAYLTTTTWLGCLWGCCLLGCSSETPAPAPDAASNANARGENPGDPPPGEARPDATTSGELSIAPSTDDRYARKTNEAAASVPAEPWTGARPELPVYPLSLEQFQAQWQIDLEAAEEPLEQVIERIVAEAPNWRPKLVVATASGDVSPDPNDVLQRPVTLKLNQVSRLEAIERVCEAAGVYPEYDHQHAFAEKHEAVIRLRPGQRGGDAVAGAAPARWVTFAGPLRIEILRVAEFPPYGVGNLKARVTSLPLPSPVRELIDGPSVTFQEVITNDDAQALTGLGQTARVIVPTALEVAESSLALQHLMRTATSLKETRGMVSLPLPRITSAVWLDSLTEGHTAQGEGVSATVRLSWATPGAWGVRYEVVSDRSLEGLVAFAFDKEGQRIHTVSYGTTWAPGFNQGSGSINLSTEPRMLAVVVVKKMQSYEREFTLENIPLARSAEQPVELPRLEFGDFERPLSVGAGELMREGIFKQVELTLHNHANKDVREIELTFSYLNAQGEKLQDSSVSVAARYQDAADPYPSLVKAGDSTKVLQSAPLCPDETAEVRVTVDAVLFSDLDRWPEGAAR